MQELTAFKGERLEDLFAAALRLFARYGFRRTRVEDIAEELGMTKGNVYFYVASKEELYYRTIEWALGAWRDEIAAAVAPPAPAAERFRKMARLSFAYLRGHDDLRLILEADPSIYSLDPAEDRFGEVNGAARDILRSIIEEGRDAGEFRAELDIEATTGFLFAVYIAFLIKTYALAEGEESARFFEAGIDIAISGLSAK